MSLKSAVQTEATDSQLTALLHSVIVTPQVTHCACQLMLGILASDAVWRPA